MTDPKSEAFHRLALKRTETITDAIRVLGNLSSPNYVWTADEVLGYVKGIETSLGEALARFKEAKCWRTSPPSSEDERSEPSVRRSEDGTLPVPDQSIDPGTVDEPDDPIIHRKMKVIEIIREANNDREALAEMVAMQREVIERLKS